MLQSQQSQQSQLSQLSQRMASVTSPILEADRNNLETVPHQFPHHFL